MTVFCEECKHLPNCELAKHEEVDTCKNGKKCPGMEDEGAEK